MSRLLMYCYYLTFIIHIQLLRISSGVNCFVAPYSQLGALRTRNRRYRRRFAISKPSSPPPSSSTRKYINTLCCGEKVEDDIEEEDEDPVALMIGDDDSTTTTTCIGEVVRLGARKYDSEHSKPSSGQYTTRKDGFTKLEITKMGIKGDYNHYRTIALDSTTDRAVSIVTTDIMTSIKATYGTKFSNQIQDGDLGENILIDGVTFDYFRIGQCYGFLTPIENKQQRQQQQRQDDDEIQHHVVVIEITEPMTPCANLCKLPYINDETIKPMDRIERCKDFLTYLGRYDGYRGWYGKVQEEGTIGIGATVSLMTVR